MQVSFPSIAVHNKAQTIRDLKPDNFKRVNNWGSQFLISLIDKPFVGYNWQEENENDEEQRVGQQ